MTSLAPPSNSYAPLGTDRLKNSPLDAPVPVTYTPGGGGALGYFFGGYVPPGIPNWHPVLEKFSPKIDTPL